MELKKSTKTRKARAKTRRIEQQEELIPICPHCPGEMILADIDYGNGRYWFYCFVCGELFKEVEVSWMEESEVEEDQL